MSAALKFKTERAGDTLIVIPDESVSDLSGTDLAAQRQLLIDEIRKSDVSSIVVDFSHVRYFGSYLLDTLCVVWRQVRERSGAMSLCSLSEVCNEIVSKSRLNSLWPVHPSREHAIEAFRPGEPRTADSAPEPRLAPEPVPKPAPRPEADSTFDPAFDPTGNVGTDSAVAQPAREDPQRRLHVLETGDCTVVGFTGGDLPPEHVVGRYHAEISQLIDKHQCREFAFDMQGIQTVPSGFLGLVATVLNRGVQVSVRHPSPEVRETFAITNLDRRVRLSDGE